MYIFDSEWSIYVYGVGVAPRLLRIIQIGISGGCWVQNGFEVDLFSVRPARWLTPVVCMDQLL